MAIVIDADQIVPIPCMHADQAQVVAVDEHDAPMPLDAAVPVVQTVRCAPQRGQGWAPTIWTPNSGATRSGAVHRRPHSRTLEVSLMARISNSFAGRRHRHSWDINTEHDFRNGTRTYRKPLTQPPWRAPFLRNGVPWKSARNAKLTSIESRAGSLQMQRPLASGETFLSRRPDVLEGELFWRGLSRLSLPGQG